MKLVRALSVLTMLLGLAAAAHADDAMSGDKKMKMKDAGKMDVAATLEANERKMNDAFKAKDAATCMSMIEANGWMADGNGFAPTSAMPDMIKDYDVKSYTIDNYKVMPIDKDAYIATYSFKADAMYKGQAMPPATFYCSTVWVKRGKEWKGLYHQESMAMPMGTSAESH